MGDAVDVSFRAGRNQWKEEMMEGQAVFFYFRDGSCTRRGRLVVSSVGSSWVPLICFSLLLIGGFGASPPLPGVSLMVFAARCLLKPPEPPEA